MHPLNNSMCPHRSLYLEASPFHELEQSMLIENDEPLHTLSEAQFNELKKTQQIAIKFMDSLERHYKKIETKLDASERRVDHLEQENRDLRRALQNATERADAAEQRAHELRTQDSQLIKLKK